MFSGKTILSAILVGAFVVTSIVGAIVLSSNVLHSLPDPMVVKIMRGDLPPCNSTVGSSDGYYCQVNNASFFCKVDATQPDPFVRTHAYCQEVVFV